ncbi:unnamed protein product [Brachionus calyciflorus]|uniref:BEN domain-containing protein n=1 Tax=Brachionus calyciflorus TaxID=104777 RepID=A0A814CNU0_9BILA|nr:unnamed protein product [Brachionus calyciflorus]
MPTILINTNLNSHRQKTSDSKNNLDSNVIQYDDMDDDFRQDINLIITKLLNKSKTLDSFTIKYDLEDTIQRQGQSDSENTDQKNHQTNCICNRMARLFNDLLQPTSSSSSSSSTSTNNSNTSTNERSNETDLRHIYKEIKLLRKYQFDLNSKFNLLIDKLDTKQNTNSPCAPSSHNSTINTSNNNNNTINNNNKQQSPQSVKLEPKINLTGAKKRKFNSFKSFTSNTTPAQDPPRSASVTSSSSSDTSSSSHTSTSTDLQTQENNTEHNETESLMLINEAQEDSSNVDLELDDEQNYQDQEEVDDYENYDEQKNFKYQIPFPRFQNFKFPYPYTPTTNQTHQTSLQNLQQQQHQHTPQKNVLSSNLNQSYDLDLNELFKGNGPKYLQLESYKNFKAPIVFVNDKYYVDDTMAALSYSKSKSRRNFAAHLTKLVFTPRERLESNCNGRFGKKALDSVRLLSIRNTIFKYYPCKQSTVILNGDKITSGDYDENSVWVRDCIPAIDESNRVLKKQLVAWYKKNNPSILIRHNTNTNNNNNNNGQNVGLSPSTSASTMYNNTGYLNANNMDDNEGFDDVDEC